MKQRHLDHAVLHAFADLDTIVHKPGEHFRPEQPESTWIEPRVTEIRPAQGSRKGQERWGVTIQVRCFLKALERGNEPEDLGHLVDLVRALVDHELVAPALKIRDDSGAVTGLLHWKSVQTRRQYDTRITIGSSAGVQADVAVLTVTAQALGGSCG